MSTDAIAGWPLGVRPISFEDLENLGIDGDGLLYWAGQPMTMQQRLVFSWPQRLIVGLALIIVMLGSVAAVVDLGLRLHF